MQLLYSTNFDVQLQSDLPHLSSYPQLLPFIGRNWVQSPYKTLILGESHYIDVDCLEESHINNWYDCNSNQFTDYLCNYIDTRGVIDRSDKRDENGFQKPFTIFYNLKNAIIEAAPELEVHPHVFPFFSFYNYYQRPALVEGESLDNDEKDDEVAYSTIKAFVEHLQPKKVIFSSKRAFNSFNHSRISDKDTSVFNDITIDVVPHAASAWWNKSSASYGGLTGRQKFIQFLKK